MDQNLITIVFGGLFILLLFILGVAGIIRGIRTRRKASSSVNWPSVRGTITNAWLEDKRETDEDGFTSTNYTAHWKYQYQLGQNTYTSDRVSFGGSTVYHNRSKAEEELARYPVNSSVQVFYDPLLPGESTLVRGTKGTLGGIIGGVVLLLLSFCGCAGGLYWLYTIQ